MTPRRTILNALETALKTIPNAEVVANPVDDIRAKPKPVLALHDGEDSPADAPQNAHLGPLRRKRLSQPVVEMYASGRAGDVRDTLDRLYEAVVAVVLTDPALRQAVGAVGGGIDIGDFTPAHAAGTQIQGAASLTLEISYTIDPTKLLRS